MPYVEVWVDECDCDCDAAGRAQDAMCKALEQLREGDQLGAIRTLGEAVEDRTVTQEREREKELAELYRQWQALPQPRPEFLTFAHGRRKLSAA